MDRRRSQTSAGLLSSGCTLSREWLHGGLLVVLVAMLGLLTPLRAGAAGTVTDCTTYGPGPGTLATALGGGGVVRFSCSGTITVPEITIATGTAIDGTGQTVSLRGDPNPFGNRVFNVGFGGELALTRVVVEEGNPFPGGEGGCILNFGTVTLTNTIVRGCFAEFFGGGIWNFGTLTAVDSTISGNTSSGVPGSTTSRCSG